MFSPMEKKWKLYWTGLIVLVVICMILCVLYAYWDENKELIELLIEMFGTFTGVYLSLVIFLKSQSDSDVINRAHLTSLKQMHDDQIEELRNATQRQINEIQISTDKQVQAIMRASNLASQAIRNTSSEKAVQALVKKSELDEKIRDIKELLLIAQDDLEEIKLFQFFRLPSKRESDIRTQKGVVENLKGRLLKLRMEMRKLAE